MDLVHPVVTAREGGPTGTWAQDLPGTEEHAKEYRKAFVVALSVVALLLCLFEFPKDDGLRHVGLAFGEARSWSEVYPHSGLALAGTYDPWFGYDTLLRGLARLTSVLPFSRLTLQFLATKLLSLVFLSSLLTFAIWRARLLPVVRDRASFTLAVALVIAFLAPPIQRILLLRPFAFGSFFLLYAIGARGLIPGAFATGALAFLYPYLFWLYSLPVAAAHLLRGSRTFGAGVAAATALGILVQPKGFWILLHQLYRSDELRASLPGISELLPLHAAPLLPLVLVLAAFLLLPFVSANAKSLGVPQLTLLFFIPVTLKYGRYLTDVEMLLLFVVFARELAAVGHAPFGRLCAYWRSAAGKRLEGRGHLPSRKPPEAEQSSPTVRCVIVCCAACLLIVSGVRARASIAEQEDLRQALAQVPENSVVLTEFNLQYRLLYLRPDLKLIPSCEIGFPAPDITGPYLQFFREGDVCSLATAAGAQFFLESGKSYLNPARVGCLQLQTEHRTEGDHWRVWRVGEPAADRRPGTP